MERRFLNVITRWETLGVRFHTIESQRALHPSSCQVPTLLKTDASFGYIVRGLLFCLLSTILAVKDHDFDGVLAYNNDFFSVVSAFVVSRIKRKPCIVMVHHYDIIDGRKLVVNLLGIYKLLRGMGYSVLYSVFKALATKVAMTIAGKCQATICVSKAFAELFSNAYISSNAVKHSLINTVTLGDKEYEACFVGRLDVRKGIMELVDVWRGVSSRLPTAKLAIVGYGHEDMLINLRRIIESYGLDKNVVYRGPLSDQEMYDTIRKSRLFITMSISEGWGMAVAEALACGVPVVCYDIITLHKQWSECPYVVFANVHDVKDATEKIVNLLCSSEPDFQDIRKCVQVLRWEDVAIRDLEILRKITNGNRVNQI